MMNLSKKDPLLPQYGVRGLVTQCIERFLFQDRLVRAPVNEVGGLTGRTLLHQGLRHNEPPCCRHPYQCAERADQGEPRRGRPLSLRTPVGWLAPEGSDPQVLALSLLVDSQQVEPSTSRSDA